jgi:hypothetical protein
LEAALKGKQSAEARRQVEELLRDLGGKPRSADAVRARRAVLVLEYIGSDEARAVLKGIAADGGMVPLALEARAALDRLEAQDHKQP